LTAKTLKIENVWQVEKSWEILRLKEILYRNCLVLEIQCVYYYDKNFHGKKIVTVHEFIDRFAKNEKKHVFRLITYVFICYKYLQNLMD